ncbi:MAG: hypothetical protein SPK87_06460 [Bacteroidales bacterium]|nr:hypothetical protein [Bacteroidales bacterium]
MAASLYQLDAHCQAILEEYREHLPEFERVAKEVQASLKEVFSEAGLVVASIEHRVKTEKSLTGKLELKGAKYATLADITDIVGVRVITFYSDDVDKVASAVDRLYKVDWENSVDKRKAHEIDSFGYMSLHYICSVPDFPYRIEIQMRTVLQHAWANMNHDTGYKSGVDVPKEYLRNLNRLAGMLELADEQFSLIRNEITDYRRRVQSLVASGNLSDVPLDADTFRSYLSLGPFDALNRRIAAVNQAEIQPVNLLNYLSVFRFLECKTLGDIDRIIKENADAAYQLACYQIGLTDLDIISSSLAPQDICIAAILKRGGGRAGIRAMFDQLNGPSESNEMMAEFLTQQAQDLPFMNQK